MTHFPRPRKSHVVATVHARISPVILTVFWHQCDPLDNRDRGKDRNRATVAVKENRRLLEGFGGGRR